MQRYGLAILYFKKGVFAIEMITKTLTGNVYLIWNIYIWVFINEEPKIRHKLFLMKKWAYYFLLFFSFVFSIQMQAQEQSIRFANGTFTTGSNIKRQAFNKKDIESALFDNNYYVLVQFEALPARQVQGNLQKAGIKLESYLPGKAYLATINKNFIFESAKQFGINSINTIPAVYKISRQLTEYRQSNDKKEGELIAVSYFSTLQKETVQRELQKANTVIINTKYESANVIFIEANKKIVETIAALPFVTSLNLQGLKDKPLNYNTRAIHGIDALNALNGKNLNGKILMGSWQQALQVSHRRGFMNWAVLSCPNPGAQLS